MVLEASLEAGHPRLDDLNEPGGVGVGRLPRNLDAEHRRQSVLVTYLAGARQRPNLEIRGGALVDTLLVRDGRVTGVRLVSGKRSRLAASSSPPVPTTRRNCCSDAQIARDPEALQQHILDFHATDYHPCGTCKMGGASDALAVVDDHCRLRGVDNLYIADASVMPTVPRCNINLPTMMIGERVAEYVRGEQ